eukprot:TRINITY_DN13967_c0_g1_i1.p1 TRINITY_DN13967_c0_g1~~TRINITY_DN13967_c0_g1_i1.p1  ORF type:complete len:126 (-),score=31.61 TRINITY_DN13967_c0_g1_i1:25-402(-)
MGDSYSNVMRGKLKLKGSPLPSLGPTKTITKKKKKRVREMPTDTEPIKIEDEEQTTETTTTTTSTSDIPDTRTPAERRYDEMIAKREHQRIEKMVEKSHREKIEEYNKKLSALSDHYDIPKVGPG